MEKEDGYHPSYYERYVTMSFAVRDLERAMRRPSVKNRILAARRLAVRAMRLICEIENGELNRKGEA